MHEFFQKHTFLRTVLDWVILFTLGLIILALFNDLDFTVSWFVPIYINLFVIAIFLYVDYVHEPSDKRMDLIQWMDNIRWINGISLVLHTTIGFYKRSSYETVVAPIWGASMESVIITLSMYISMIIVPSVIIFIVKRPAGHNKIR